MISFAEKVRAAKLPQFPLVLALVPGKDLASVSASVLRALSTGGGPGVYVTVNKPCDSLEAFFRKARIDLKKIFFLDLITLSSGGTAEKKERRVFLESPRNLTEFSIALNELIAAIPAGKKFVVIDSFNTLLLYNDATTVMRFIHFLSGRLRTLGAHAVFLSAKEETDEKTIAQLNQFVEKVVDFSE
ncbi:MAG: ATPase domain-containing protein [Candidatus Micrarchaeota archaeon]